MPSVTDQTQSIFTHCIPVILSRKKQRVAVLNPYPAKLIYLNFQPLEVVSRYRDPRPQVLENYSCLFNLRPKIYKSLSL